MNERGKLFAILIGLNVLWTPVNLVVRAATQHGLSPTAVALGRWATLAVLMQVLLRIPAFARFSKLQWPSPKDRWLAMLLGAFLFAPAHALYYLALTRGASTVGGTVLNATAPIWVAALAFVILRERATPRRLMAIAVGFVGAWVVVCGFGLPRFDGDRLGDLYYLVGVILESCASVIGTRIVRRSSGIGFLAWEVVGMVPTLCLLPLLTGGAMPITVHQPDLTAFLAVGYLVIFPGLICFGTWLAIVEKVPLSTMIVTILLQPPLSALLAWFFAGETVGLTVGIGSVLIVSALLISSSEKRLPQEPLLTE